MDFTLQKPIISETKTLTKSEQLLVEIALKKSGRLLIHPELKPLKNDYQHDIDRGTVAHTDKCRDYAFHKIIIPDSTIIRDTNFSQKEPHTQAIQGKDLYFINCNLVNVEKDPTWTCEGCNNCQVKNIKKSETDLGDRKRLVIEHYVENPRVKGEFKKEYEKTKEFSNEEYNLKLLRLN